MAQESLKKKLEAAKARRSVLENDLSTSKKTVALLNEKTTHDNQLIEALHVSFVFIAHWYSIKKLFIDF